MCFLSPKDKRYKDRKYLDSYRDNACLVKGCTEPRDTVVGAHINEETWITGGKGSDYDTLPLCGVHHTEQGSDRTFWFKHIPVKTILGVKMYARSRFLTWSGLEELP